MNNKIRWSPRILRILERLVPNLLAIGTNNSRSIIVLPRVSNLTADSALAQIKARTITRSKTLLITPSTRRLTPRLLGRNMNISSSRLLCSNHLCRIFLFQGGMNTQGYIISFLKGRITRTRGSIFLMYLFTRSASVSTTIVANLESSVNLLVHFCTLRVPCDKARNSSCLSQLISLW